MHEHASGRERERSNWNQNNAEEKRFLDLKSNFRLVVKPSSAPISNHQKA
jgi:hypothetical protein